MREGKLMLMDRAHLNGGSGVATEGEGERRGGGKWEAGNPNLYIYIYKPTKIFFNRQTISNFRILKNSTQPNPKIFLNPSQPLGFGLLESLGIFNVPS